MIISILAGGEKPPIKEPPKGTNPNTTEEPTQTEGSNLECPLKEITDHTTEPHRIPTIEVHPTKTASTAKHQEAKKQTKRFT